MDRVYSSELGFDSDFQNQCMIPYKWQVTIVLSTMEAEYMHYRGSKGAEIDMSILYGVRI